MWATTLTRARLRTLLVALTAASVAACSRTGTIPAGSSGGAAGSTSPGAIQAPPMIRAVAPATAMTRRHAQLSVAPLGFTTLSGTASYIAAALNDQTIWALSQDPTGPDKYIYSYSNGAWTNVPGEASRIAVSANGTLYAVNSSGSLYSYNSGVGWTTLGGGSIDVTAGPNNAVYVTSNSGAGPDRDIWRNAYGVWTQMPGRGIHLSASWDTVNRVIPAGRLAPGGFYIVNAAGGVYYENPDQTIIQLPSTVATVASTTRGGLFALGYPADPNGTPIFYYDYDAPGWAAPGGSGTSIATNGSQLYVTGSDGTIYQSTINTGGISGPTAMAVTNACDQHAYVYNGFASTNAPISTLGPTPTIGNVGVAFDTGSNGLVWIANHNAGTVSLYTGLYPPYNNVLRTISAPFPQAITVDAMNRLYVASNNSISVYAGGQTGSNTPIRTFGATGASNVQGIAVDAAGYTWSTDTNDVLSEFVPTASGIGTPFQHVSGSSTQLSSPSGIFVDRQGHVWVTGIVANAGAIEEFDPGLLGSSSGENIAPIRIITGTATQLIEPSAIAVDPTGAMYVNDEGSVRVYASWVNGNVPPERSFNFETGVFCTGGLGLYYHPSSV